MKKTRVFESTNPFVPTKEFAYRYKGMTILKKGKNNYELRAGFFGDRTFTSLQKAKEWIAESR